MAVMIKVMIMRVKMMAVTMAVQAMEGDDDEV